MLVTMVSKTTGCVLDAHLLHADSLQSTLSRLTSFIHTSIKRAQKGVNNRDELDGLYINKKDMNSRHEEKLSVLSALGWH